MEVVTNPSINALSIVNSQLEATTVPVPVPVATGIPIGRAGALLFVWKCFNVSRLFVCCLGWVGVCLRWRSSEAGTTIPR